MQLLQRSWKIFLIAWAGPYTAMGLAIGLTGLISGGGWRWSRGAIEFYGGATAWLVRHLPPGPSTRAITLGHVILGQTVEGLDACAAHERIHVRQFELWGPAMGPAYLAASAWQWCRGRDAYRQNYFERQAYSGAPSE